MALFERHMAHPVHKDAMQLAWATRWQGGIFADLQSFRTSQWLVQVGNVQVDTLRLLIWWLSRIRCKTGVMASYAMPAGQAHIHHPWPGGS